MELQKINVKFFVVEPNEIPLTDFIDIFHGWIQATDGVYHDVADYSHMQEGPGIVLVAADANVSIDETEGRRGLLYKQKAPLAGSNQEKLKQVVRSALENCLRLEKDPGLAGRIKFCGEEVQIAVNDRLIAPNVGTSLSELKADAERFLGKLYCGSTVAIEPNSEPRQCLGLKVKAAKPFTIANLIESL